MSRSESAVGTPYFAPEGLILGLTSFSISYQSAGEKYRAEPLHRPKAVFLPEEADVSSFTMEVEINPKGIESGIRELGLSKEGVQLLIVLRIPALKRFEVLHRSNVNGKSPKHIQIVGHENHRLLVNLAKSSTVTISAYLVIKEVSRAKIFFPPPPGTWLAGLGFRIQPPHPSFDFTPIPLDLPAAKRLRIPMGTFVFVDFQEENATNPLIELSDAKEALNVYVNEDVFTSLLASTNVEARTMLVASIRSAALTQIIFELSAELENRYGITWEALSGSDSLASKIISGIRPSSMTEEDFMRILVIAPLQAIAYADSELKTAAEIRGAM